MSDELHLYDVVVNGAPTTLQLTAAEAALRFPGVKPNAKTRPAATDDDHAVPNKARRNP